MEFPRFPVFPTRTEAETELRRIERGLAEATDTTKCSLMPKWPPNIQLLEGHSKLVMAERASRFIPLLSTLKTNMQ